MRWLRRHPVTSASIAVGAVVVMFAVVLILESRRVGWSQAALTTATRAGAFLPIVVVSLISAVRLRRLEAENATLRRENQRLRQDIRSDA